MNKRMLRWVYQELPELVDKGVISAEVAERIRQYYSRFEEAKLTVQRRIIILLGVIGTGWIGTGIILLLAHNWEELSRPERTIISILPLVVTGILGGWLLWTRRQSVAWAEGVGTAQTLAIGISIALISQTYNLGGNFDEFILTWSLLALPIAYLLETIVPALFYLVGITVWVFNVIYHHMSFFYFLLLGAILPFLWWEINDKGRYHIRVILFLWILAITVPTAMCKIINIIEPVPVWLSSLFVLFYIAGSRWWSEGLSRGGNPLKIVGLLVTIIFSFEMSDSDLWEYNKNLLYNGMTFDTGLQLAVIILLNIITIVLWIKCWPRRQWEEIIIGVVPVLAIIGWAMAQEGLEATTAFLFSVYLFILGIGTIMAGKRLARLGRVNFGMAILVFLILDKFFDIEASLILQGVVFIIIGICFLVVNLRLARKWF